MRAMKVVTVASQKGGVGKTTLTVNLAGVLASKGKKVLILDMDPQAAASGWLLGSQGGKGLLEVLTEGGSLGDLVEETRVRGLEIIPGSGWTGVAEKLLGGEPGAELILRKALEKLPRRWDFLFLDTPPSLGLLTLQALTGSDLVLVPTEPGALALGGVGRLLHTLEKVQDRLNSSLLLEGIVLCRVSQRTRLYGESRDLLERKFGKKVFQTFIRESVRHKEAPGHRLPIHEYDPNGHGAEDFRALGVEFLKRQRNKETNGNGQEEANSEFLG